MKLLDVLKELAVHCRKDTSIAIGNLLRHVGYVNITQQYPLTLRALVCVKQNVLHINVISKGVPIPLFTDTFDTKYKAKLIHRYRYRYRY